MVCEVGGYMSKKSKKMIMFSLISIFVITGVYQHNSKRDTVIKEHDIENISSGNNTANIETSASGNTTDLNKNYTTAKNDTLGSNSSSYSKGDTCSHGSCTKKRISGSKFCGSHTCAETDCYKEVNSANERCEKHKQEYYDRLGIGDLDSVTNCVVSGCNTDAYKDSKYCISHKCRQNGCNNGQYGGNKYCYEHCLH
jgi:hypothetical protein